MPTNFNHRNKILEIIVYSTIIVTILWGGICVVFEVQPFWTDEWRIIYNLKFKSPKEIWGELAYMQQFPRVYLYLLKLFTSSFQYSYQSLRFIPWLAGLGAIGCIHAIANRLYDRRDTNRLLMIMMLISCGTFTTYYTEVKQYTMELLLSAAAVWQLYYALHMNAKSKDATGYALFCISLLCAPFFSYTYPIVIMPVYAVVLLHNIANWNNGEDTKQKITQILLQWAPLFLCTFSITLFYLLDARHLSTDSDMQSYWKHLLNTDGFRFTDFLERLFHFFAQAGSGFVFWWLFGLSCSSAFMLAIVHLWKSIKIRVFTIQTYLVAYSVILVILVAALNLANKLPLGEPRLNAFAIPALSILLINLLNSIKGSIGKLPLQKMLLYSLLAGLTGNIYTTIIASFTDEKYARRMQIYHATEHAVRVATEQNLPILITPEVTWPYNKTQNFPFEGELPGDWVLMTWHAYRPNRSPKVYAIPDTNNYTTWMRLLPQQAKRVMAGDGIHYRIVESDRQ
jgi:hypothetical protein